MYDNSVIEKTRQHVRDVLEGEGSGHDYWHIYRVWRMARHICQEEKADSYVVELAALLHDIADWKFHKGDLTVGPKIAKEYMEQLKVNKETINHVCEIIENCSYKGAGVTDNMRTAEGKIVQDADRLDAIGVIGIGRAFAYSGHKNMPMHDPEQKPTLHATKEAYFNSNSSTINHFHEKLLLLKDRMNTKTAKKIAEGRHAFMQEFLERFHKEWEGDE